jgi:integrase
LNYAVERRYLPHNPLRDIRVKRQLTAEAIDPRVVVNPAQARDLLNAVRVIEPTVHAYFACLYYAGLRPAEARNLRRADLELPETGWGQIVLHSGYQESGTAWTDDGSRGEERHLKHRAETETRVVPAHPELVQALRDHFDAFGTGVGGRLFVTRTGRGGYPIAAPYQNPVSMSTVYRVWAAAREKALTAEQAASPLAGRPYDLRHAAVSTWLHAGVDSTQVAAWAGHSVAVLMRVYASCLHGHEEIARRLIEAAMASSPEIL